MIIRRRTWMYRMPGHRGIQSISFKVPVTASQVRETLRRSVGLPSELWGRSADDLLMIER